MRDVLSEDALHRRDRTLQQDIKPDLLIIDDMGLRALPKHSDEYLLEVIIMHREALEHPDQQSAARGPG